MNVAQKIAVTAQAYHNCVESGNPVWEAKHEELIHDIEDNYLPSGCGFDAGTIIDIARTDTSQVVLKSAFHVMDEVGMYAGWVDFNIFVTTDFMGVCLDFGNIQNNSDEPFEDFEEYLAQVFYHHLEEEPKW